MKVFFKAVWSMCCLAVLALTLWSYTPSSNSDIGIFLVGAMTALAFPLSLVVSGTITLLVMASERLSVPYLDVVESGYTGFVLLWMFYFAAGYWQWFWLVPRLAHKAAAIFDGRKESVDKVDSRKHGVDH
ncbi:MAG: hypothetical protein IPJ33_01715 [Gammaproteobacteria bacterium]|nr:hypothetical protein [Gammaproteobacteria bacterium]MBK6583930.1 hypothetical protein [Gammaproteobacteria bacterium]MBK7727240.1 hypothetical protein [Gammaproteobacteria bacterium]MBK9664905.1 hypothetical protein [Gammaproteobacteria bacterium]